MRLFRYINPVIALLPLALASCSEERMPSADDTSRGVPAVMYVTINDAQKPWSRYNAYNEGDYWSTRSFSLGDRIGIFSTGGLVGPNGESQWILNEYMDYDQATGSSNYRFRNDELLINTGMMGGNVGKYVYFPYTEDMPLPIPGQVTWKDSSDNEYYAGDNQQTPNNMTSKPGMYLRVPGTDYKGKPIERCLDYMYISSPSITNGALGGGFYHGFSEMIIVRGKGFDEVDETLADSITVVLTAGYTRMRLNAFRSNASGAFSWRPQNYYWNPDATDHNITQEQAKRWKAWKGEDYVDVDDETGEPFLRDAWYVILPTAHSYSYPSVAYIELYNNEGKICQVSNFDLYVSPETGIADKQMRPGYRYAVEVLMVEVGATIRPHEIVEWNEGVAGENDITDIRTAGINGYDDFRNWTMAYNKFITDVKNNSIQRPDSAEVAAASPLAQYGDYDLDKRKWRFYINGDIAMPNNSDAGIVELQDILEGASQFSNFTISNVKGTFIDSITPGGELRNLDFNNLYVKPSSGSYVQGTAGAVTHLLKNGSISNCSVNNGTMIGSAAGTTIGMLCGTVSGTSTVTKCSVSGAVIGSTWGTGTVYAPGMFGNVATGATVTYSGNDASGLIVTSN